MKHLTIAAATELSELTRELGKRLPYAFKLDLVTFLSGGAAHLAIADLWGGFSWRVVLQLTIIGEVLVVEWAWQRKPISARRLYLSQPGWFEHCITACVELLNEQGYQHSSEQSSSPGTS